MKKLYYSSLLLVLTTNLIFGHPKDTIDHFLNAVVYIRWENTILSYDSLADNFKKSSTYEYGTGFFIKKEFTINQKKHYKKFLVTCKHNLPELSDKSNSIELRVYKNDSNNLRFVHLPIKDKSGNYTNNLIFGKNGEDIVAIEISDFWDKNSIKNESLPYNLITNVNDLKAWAFNAGDLLYFLGFPNSIYHEENLDPILRLGVTATDPKKPYKFNSKIQHQYGLQEYFEGFLLDASLFNGSSGSLVFYFPMSYPHPAGAVIPTTHHNYQKNPSFRERPFIIGMISNSFSDKDKDNQWLDLGIVISYKVIKDTIDQFTF